MNKRDHLQNNILYEWLAFGGFALLLLLAHALIRPDFGDDVTYAGIWGKQPFLHFYRSAI